jgi:hypothetical protein
MAYRSRARTPRIIVSERLRAGRGMLALAAFAVLLGFTFSTTSRVTVSCSRGKTPASEPRIVRCLVTESSSWSRSTVTRVFPDPRTVTVEHTGHVSRVLVDGLPLVDTPFDTSDNEVMAKWTMQDDSGFYAIGHAGGFVLDGRMLLGAIVTATVALLLAIRHHRVIVDREEEEIRATSSVAFLPFRTQRTSIRKGDRLVARTDGARASLLLVGSRASIVLIEDDACGESVERLAKRLEGSLSQPVEG